MKDISFIHCSDIHLGCQQFNEPQRWDDFGRTFAGIVDYAIAIKADYFLIGGDLFHHRSINAQTLEQSIVQLKRLQKANIQVIAIEGNHDKAFYLEGQSWMDFLNEEGFIKLLKPQIAEGKIQLNTYDGEKGCIFEAEGIRIIGLGYLGATTRQRLEEVSQIIKPSDDFTIMLLHAAVDKLMGQDMAGVSSKVLESFHGVIDYLALGHIHSRQEQDGYIYNPGAPESVHIDEAKNNKQKGFYHVIISGKSKEVKFVESKKRNIHYINIDFTGTAQPDDAAEKIIKHINNLAPDENSMIQITLTGWVDFQPYVINVNEISEAVKAKYNLLAVEIVNNTNMAELSGDNNPDTKNRINIERTVIKNMIAQEKPEFKEIEDEFVDLVLKIKNHSVNDVNPEDFITIIDEVMGEMLLSKSEAATTVESICSDDEATSWEGGFGNENQ